MAATLGKLHPPWKPLPTQANPQPCPFGFTDAKASSSSVSCFSPLPPLVLDELSPALGSLLCIRGPAVWFSVFPVNFSTIGFSLLGLCPLHPYNYALFISAPLLLQ